MILIFVTFPNKKEAIKIVNHLIDKRLAGCATMFPVNSFYWWEGKKVHDDEIETIIKTTKGKFAEIKKEVERLHSYSVPQIIAVGVSDVSEKYNNWLKGEIK